MKAQKVSPQHSWMWDKFGFRVVPIQIHAWCVLIYIEWLFLMILRKMLGNIPYMDGDVSWHLYNFSVTFVRIVGLGTYFSGVERRLNSPDIMAKINDQWQSMLHHLLQERLLPKGLRMDPQFAPPHSDRLATQTAASANDRKLRS